MTVTVALLRVIGPADIPLLPEGIVISAVILLPFVLIIELLPKNGYLSSASALVLLKPVTDYQATSGTTVILTTGASVSDVVEIIAYDAFTIANSYTKAEADDRYPFLGNNSMIRTNGNTITADITIPTNTNGMSAGPITLNNATVTVNGVWTVV